VRVEAWFAIVAAFSSVPPFSKEAVIPVARRSSGRAYERRGTSWIIV